ncbi:MAG TPA: Na+/H+ antiporter [Streptosporangiaceae bacterium]
MRTVETVVFLVALATVVAAFAHRLSAPAPSLLVVVGLGVGMLPGAPSVNVPPELISLVVLPPLLYAASEELPWRDLRAVWLPVGVLAVGLVMASAAAAAAVAGLVASLSVSMAFVLGAVLASTDPVAVNALGRRLALPGKVQTLVQAESLFNDGTSLVLFQVAVSMAVGGAASAAAPDVLLHGAAQFAAIAGGGVLAGIAVAVAAIAVRRRITDPVLETVAALITPYGAFLLADAFHASGVTAVIVAGLAVGRWRQKITTARTRLQVHAVYQTLIFLLESVVFSLIGLQLPTLIRALSSTRQWLLPALVVTATLILIRLAWVFALWAAARWRGRTRSGWATPAVISWAGTRGVVPLAAALSIPLDTINGNALPQRDVVLVIATASIVFSLVAQGFTLEPLARMAGLGHAAATARRHEEAVARVRLAEAALARLDELSGTDAVSDALVDRVRANLQERIGTASGGFSEGSGGGQGKMTERALRRDLIAAEMAELARLSDDGTISSQARQGLQRNLDLELARLTNAPS